MKATIFLIYNSALPYRIAAQELLVEFFPSIEFVGFATHGVGEPPLQLAANPACKIHELGPGQSVRQQTKILFQCTERKKAKIIFQEIVRAEGPKFVILMGYNDLGRISLINQCFKSKIPLYLFGDSNDAIDRPGKIKLFLKMLFFKWLGSKISGVLACGSAGRRYFGKYGFSDNRIGNFPYTISNHFWRNTQINGPNRCFLFCGRLVESKRPDLVVAAFLRISEQLPEWKLHIIGSGPLEGSLKSMVPEGLRSRVVFEGLLSTPSETRQIFRFADILVHPAIAEPFGVVIEEAAASGLAIITTKTCGAGEDLVQNFVNGRILDAPTIVELASAMRQLASNEVVLNKSKVESLRVYDAWTQKFNIRDFISSLVPEIAKHS